jgi:hypothetical protein
MTTGKFFSASLRKMVCHPQDPVDKDAKALRKNATHFFTLPTGRQVRAFGPLWLKSILYKIVHQAFTI